MTWIAERTVSTHNHPTRYWETAVLCPISGLVATSSSDSKEGAEQLARLIAAAPELLEALKAWEHWYNVDSTEFNRDCARDMGLKAIAKSEGK